MTNDDTTLKGNPVKLAQHILDQAAAEFEQAQGEYKHDRSDANLEALEAARAHYLRVEAELRAGQLLLLKA